MNNIDYQVLVQKAELYEPVQKTRFLLECEYADSTKENIIRMFKKTRLYEEKFRTDISNFNEKQYFEFLKRITSDITMNSYSSYLKSYNELINPSNKIVIIDIARDNGLLDITHDMKISENSFPSRYDFYGTINEKIASYRDRLVMALIYEGIEIEELLDIQQSDYQEDRLYIKGKYILVVDRILAEIIEGAISETHYVVKNGQYNLNTRSPNRKYKETDKIYLIKLTKKEKHRESQVISQIFRRSKEYINKKKLTATILRKLALLNYVNIYTAIGDNEHDAFMKAFKRFRLDVSDPTEKAVNMTEFRKAMSTFLLNYKIDYDIIGLQSICDINTINQQNGLESTNNEEEPKEPNEPEAHASDNTDSGLLGEKVVFELLKHKCITGYEVKKANEKNDYAGYDISIFKDIKEIEKIEVKTVKKNFYRFYISKHELVTAEEYPENYYVYILRYSNIEDLRNDDIEFLKKNTSLLRIKNPIEYFGIDMDYVKRKILMPGVCTIKCKELEIDEINFDGFEVVEL